MTAALRQDIIDELDFEPSVKAAHIGVAVDSGVVTLSGHVCSYAEKLAAEQAAKRVKGVKAIAQEIEVRYPSDKKTGDDEIAERAINILLWNAVVPSRPNPGQGAEWLGDLDGCRRVAISADRGGKRNSPAVRRCGRDQRYRDQSPSAVQADVKRKIEDALKRHAEIEAQRIQRFACWAVAKVALDGSVHDWQERDAVKLAAWSAPGVASVEDRLTIA